MPYISEEELTLIRDRIQRLEDEIKNIRGRPILQGYQGMRLDLNDNLNVVALKKDITDLKSRATSLESRVTALETP